MNIVFSALSPTAPDNYLNDKLKACRMKLSATQIEQLRQNVSATSLPLIAEAELPPFTAAQNNVIEVYKQQVLDNLGEMLPTVAGEKVEATSFSLLTDNYQNFAADTPVVTVTTNFSTLQYLFTGYRVENGALKEIPASPRKLEPGAAGVSPEAAIVDSIGDLIGDLATAVAGDGLGWVVSKILDSIESHFFKSAEVKELEQYVKQAIEENNIANANERLHAVLNWMCNVYTEKTSREDLNEQLQILTEVVMPVLPKYIAALPVYAVAANSALLICQRMDELDSTQKLFPIYAPRYINEMTQLLRDAFSLRAGYVVLTNDASGHAVDYQDNLHYQVGPFFNYPPCKPGLYDAVTLQAEYSRLTYIWDTLYPQFSDTYGSCIASVETWCEKNNQPAPRFAYGDRLCGVTNDYLSLGLGIISAQKKYCLLYYKPEHMTEPYDDNQAKLVIFSTGDGTPSWKSDGAAKGWRVYMQADCNFVVYSDVPEGWKQPDANQNIWDLYAIEKSDQYYSTNSSAVFSSNTPKGGTLPLDYYIVMQDDGKLVIYPNGYSDTAHVVWSAP